MMAWLIKVILIVGCLLGIYVFLMSISPKSKNLRTKDPILKPITLVTSATPIISPQMTSTIPVVEIAFDGSKFSPGNVEMIVGSKLVFKNISQVGMWIASDPHPTHNLYSELNSGGMIQPGGSFEFVPSKLGIWGYHNDLPSNVFGGISGSIQVK